MRHEKLLKREDGTKYQIHVSFWVDYDKAKYNVEVYKCEKGKRTFLSVHSTDDYKWRELGMGAREFFKENLFLQHVTTEEIQQAKLELWEKLKP